MTVAKALPVLLKIAAKPDLHRRVLGCDRHPRGHRTDVGHDYPMLDWSVCPLDLLSHPLFAALWKLDRLAAVAPLSSWPEGYSPWAVEGLLALKARRGE